MNNGTIKKALIAEIQSPRQSSDSSKGRLHNINWIKNLSRTGLIWGVSEKQIHIVTTEEKEELYIQYPGKESKRNDNPRPWDFRPRIYVPEKEKYISSIQSFSQIWDALYDISKGINPVALRMLAMLFYRIAFMCDHHLPATEQKVDTRYARYNNTDNEDIKKTVKEPFKAWYRYEPSKQILGILARAMPTIGGISLEAFLHYNNLLAWNEDCKYYYRNYFSSKYVGKSKNKWIVNTGRINNLLTHISVIGLIQGKIKIAEFAQRFARSRGVSVPAKKELAEILKDYILLK